MRKTSKVVSWIFIAVMLAVTYVPMLVLMVYSFTDTKSINGWNGFTFDLYAEMFTDSEILTALMNSLIIGLSASLIAAIVGTLAAIGIFYMKKLPKAFMDGVTQITLVNADIVTAVAFVLFFMAINIPRGYLALILSHSIICMPYVIMSVTPRLSQLNPNVYEAGLDLGASPLRTLFTVILPQLVPGIISGFALAFTISMDDYTISTFLKGDVTTIPIYLYTKLTKKGIPPVLRALSTVLLVVSFTVLLLINLFSSKKNKKQQNLPAAMQE